MDGTTIDIGGLGGGRRLGGGGSTNGATSDACKGE